MIEFLFDILALGCSSYILLAVLALVMLVILLACFETDPIAGTALTLILLLLGAFAVRDQKKKKLSREEEDTGLFEPEQEKKSITLQRWRCFFRRWQSSEFSRS